MIRAQERSPRISEPGNDWSGRPSSIAYKMSDTAQSLSLERKIKMHEARESIITRLALAFPTTINLDRFLNVIVSELGRMMNVDRCDVIQLTSQSELRISHEWRASTDVPSSLGTVIPLDLKQLSEHVNITKPIRLDDTSRPGLDQKVRFLAASLGTRSLLVVPVVLGDDVLGLVGMHTTRTPLEPGSMTKFLFWSLSPDRSRWAISTRGSTPIKSARPKRSARCWKSPTLLTPAPTFAKSHRWFWNGPSPSSAPTIQLSASSIPRAGASVWPPSKPRLMRPLIPFRG